MLNSRIAAGSGSASSRCSPAFAHRVDRGSAADRPSVACRSPVGHPTITPTVTIERQRMAIYDVLRCLHYSLNILIAVVVSSNARILLLLFLLLLLLTLLFFRVLFFFRLHSSFVFSRFSLGCWNSDCVRACVKRPSLGNYNNCRLN